MVNLKGDDKSRYVSAMFDKVAERYDLMNTIMSGGMHHFWRKKASRLALQGIEGDILDIATGTGDFAIELARSSKINRVVGLDFSAKMLPIARNKSVKKHLINKSDWVLGNAMTLPFVGEHFICVTIGFGLRNFSDKGKALTEVMRVLKPGGKLVVLDIIPLSGKSPLNVLSKLYFNRVVPLLGSVFAGSKEAYTYLPDSVENYLSPSELVSMMEGVGLQNISYGTIFMNTIAFHVAQKG